MRKLAIIYEKAYTRIRPVRLYNGEIFDHVGHRKAEVPELHLSRKHWPYLFKLEK